MKGVEKENRVKKKKSLKNKRGSITAREKRWTNEEEPTLLHYRGDILASDMQLVAS